MDKDKQNAIESILTALGHRFENIPEGLADQMATLDLEKIDSLWVIIFDAGSIDVILDAIGQTELV